MTKADLTNAIMGTLEAHLKWTRTGSYSGDWRKDIEKARKSIQEAEDACNAIENFGQSAPAPTLKGEMA